MHAAYGSISSRTDDRDESERSLSSSYLPFFLLGGYGQDLSLRRTRMMKVLLKTFRAVLVHDGMSSSF